MQPACTLRMAVAQQQVPTFLPSQMPEAAHMRTRRPQNAMSAARTCPAQHLSQGRQGRGCLCAQAWPSRHTLLLCSHMAVRDQLTHS